MTDDTPLPFDLSAVRRKKLTVDFGGGNQSSNGGLLLLRRAERNIGICRRLADAMPDRRDASRIRHAMFEMVMARVCAIACGHEDAIDLDRLRHDPLMKVAVGRCPQSGAPLASQSTISRSGECAEQDRGGAAHRRSCRSGRRNNKATQAGDPRHRRHVLRGAWLSATCVLERPSRRTRLRVDARLSRGERHPGGDDPAPGAHPQELRFGDATRPSEGGHYPPAQRETFGGVASYNRMEEVTYQETVAAESQKERFLAEMLTSASAVPRILPAHLRVLVRRIDNAAARTRGRESENSSDHVQLP